MISIYIIYNSLFEKTILAEALSELEHYPDKHYFEISDLGLLNTNNNTLSLLHLSIGSLSAHFDHLQDFLATTKITFDLICITESKISFDNCNLLSNVTLPGYVIESQGTEASKGGVVFYIKTEFKYRIRNDLKMYKSRELESLFLEIDNHNGETFIVGGIYKHPCLDAKTFNNEFFSKTLTKMSGEKGKKVILAGDFNINLLNYSECEAMASFVEMIYTNAYKPHILAPTRITLKSKTLIDNIFLNLSDDNVDAGNLTLGISDHLPQFFIYKNRKNYEYYEKILKRAQYKDNYRA